MMARRWLALKKASAQIFPSHERDEDDATEKYRERVRCWGQEREREVVHVVTFFLRHVTQIEEGNPRLQLAVFTLSKLAASLSLFSSIVHPKQYPFPMASSSSFIIHPFFSLFCSALCIYLIHFSSASRLGTLDLLVICLHRFS